MVFHRRGDVCEPAGPGDRALFRRLRNRGWICGAQDLSKPRQLRIWKISPEGALLWKRDFGGITQAEAYDVITTDDRATVIGDVTWPDSTGAGNGNTDGWILIINGQGQLLGQQTYSAKYALHGRVGRFDRIARTSDGYAVLGEVGGAEFQGTALWFLRMQPDALPSHSLCSP